MTQPALDPVAALAYGPSAPINTDAFLPTNSMPGQLLLPGVKRVLMAAWRS